MAIAWPANLPGCAESWEEFDQPVTVRTNMDAGQPKVRRRFTRTMRAVRVNFVMDHAQAMALRTYFEIDLQGGVQEHQFRHPFSNAVEAFRFMEAPRISEAGAFACAVSCAWEQL